MRLTLKYLAVYWKYKVQRLNELKDEGHGWEFYTLIANGIIFIFALLMSYWDGWAAYPVVKALNISGWLLLLYGCAHIFTLLFLVWQDLVKEYRNERPETPLTLVEIRKRELDFERWCR